MQTARQQGETLNSSTNPFITGSPAKGDAFFGRSDLLVEVEYFLNKSKDNSLMIDGQRRIGKTSFLRKLYTDIKYSHYSVLFDLQDKARITISQLLYELAKKIIIDTEFDIEVDESHFTEDQAAHYFQNVFFPQIIEKIENPQFLVILFDEFDVLTAEETDTIENTQAAYSQFIPLMNQLREKEYPIKLIFAIGRNYKEVSTAHYGQLMKFSQRLELAYFELDELTLLLKNSTQNLSIQFEQTAIDKIYQLTHAHPYFSQCLASAAFELAEKNKQSMISSEIVQDIFLKSVERFAGGLLWLWDSFSPAEKVILYLLALLQENGRLCSCEMIEQKAESLSLMPAIDNLACDLEKLIKIKVVYKKVGKYGLLVEYFRQWILLENRLEEIRVNINLTSKDVNFYLNNAKHYLEKKNYPRAIQFYEDILEIYPSYFGALIPMAQIYQKTDFEKAENYFEKAYQQVPDKVQELYLQYLLQKLPIYLEKHKNEGDSEKSIVDKILQMRSDSEVLQKLVEFLIIYKNYLPSYLPDLSTISMLDLRNKGLQKISPDVVKLVNLRFLDLRDNQIAEIPSELIILNIPIHWQINANHRGIFLEGNPLETPPVEIIQQGQHAISSYFESREQKAPLNEVKVIILGEGGVGKTSLVKRLLFNEFDDCENKTDGINIENWQVNINNENIRLNVWDFGGQEIMHATHQFFLTKRSLYILLIDARQGKKLSRLEYWLKIILTYGGHSPVLIVINKSDQHQIQLNEKFLLQKYPNIQGFYNISCKTGNGLEELKITLKNQINKLPHVHDILPKTWFDLKQQLENMRRDFLSYDDYLKACEKHQITDTSSQHTLINLLHDLGVVLNFRHDEKHPQLRNTNILKPSWLTDAIYIILNSNVLFKNKGILEIRQLSALLDNKRYPESQYPTLLQLMEKFELCFKVPDMERESYLIVDLLDPQEPDIVWNDEDCLRFEYHYDVLPNSVFSRFLVRTHRYISQKTYWLTGVMLCHEENKALIKADIEDKKIMIWINGKLETRRILLSIIRTEFKTTHNSFAKLSIQEIIPYKTTFIQYDSLLKLEQRNAKYYYLPEVDEAIDIDTFLNGLSTSEHRQQEYEEAKNRYINISGNVSNSNLNLGDNVQQLDQQFASLTPEQKVKLLEQLNKI